MIQNFLWVAAGGSAGAIFRYGISLFMQNQLKVDAPFATLTVNWIGCFLIGFAFPFFETGLDARHRLLLITGFLGSFTTFSTFALDTATMPSTVYALFYTFSSVLVGLALTFFGIALGNKLTG